MRKAVYTVVGLTVTLGSWADRVWAQHHAQAMPPPGFYNGLTPNSTVEGDVSRLGAYGALASAPTGGSAAAVNAVGAYNLLRSHADSVDMSNMIRWNEYLAATMEVENNQSLVRRGERRKHLIAMYNLRKQRIANDPTELDLFNGDALNALLEQLSNPKISPSLLRKSGESIPGETIQRCAFRYPSFGLTISLGRLTVRDGWPFALRGMPFAEERKAYHAAVEKALEQNLAGNLTPEAFRAVQAAVKALTAKYKATIPASEKDDFVQAKVFLEDLEEAVSPLRNPNAEKVLAGVDRYAGTTLGEAVAFMQRFNLRFASALTDYERESYHLLYAGMLRLRDGIFPGAAGKARNE
jgi:hypothetical protein